MASPSPGIALGAAVDALPGLPFRSAAEHLLAELACLKLFLHRQVLRLRAASLLREDQFRGLYISDEEVDAILNQGSAGDPQSPERSRSVTTMRDLSIRIDSAAAEISSRLQASQLAGLSIPLFRLSRIFGLSPFEQFALLICVAPELDARFETLYSYVQNDVTRKRPTPDLILKLFCSSLEESLTMRIAFSPAAKLLRIPLIRLGADPPDRESSFLARPLRAEPHIVDYLLEQGELDERLRPFVTISNPALSFATLHLPNSLIEEIQKCGNSLAAPGGVIFLHGPKGCGKRSVADAISMQHHRPLLTARLEELTPDQLPLPQALQLLQREALLQGANLFLGSAETLFGSDAAAPQKRNAFLSALDPDGFLIFVGSNSSFSLADASSKYTSLSFAIPPPDFAHRTLLWSEAIEAMNRSTSPDVDPAVLANKFTLTGGEIHSICREVAARVLLRDSAGGVSLADIESAARGQSNQGLRRLAQKVNCIQDWPDLVLPARSIRQLREVCSSERFRHIVYSQWGYDRRLAQSRGLNVLFCGASGTGKTMAAGIIARGLALDLYKIDLSSVVSKYIGETEKQLSQIFHEAGSSNAILFFDEADALFGKRSEVKDAHDRYANVEVAYLLQKMEEYEGIVILATNFRRNLDDAFTRRMHHIVEFPFPDADCRERIWKRLVPSGAPLSADVNFGFLARQFELSGGNIRNVALAAAFLAAESGGEICMEHFILGTSRELQKLGKMPSRSEFREYYDLLRSSA
jgi:ATP-dependent 26S proteasome regulatory subunit